MANLDSILKSRDITLSTEVCLVKAMVFPLVMYGCESWSIKKADGLRPRPFCLLWALTQPRGHVVRLGDIFTYLIYELDVPHLTLQP